MSGRPRKGRRGFAAGRGNGSNVATGKGGRGGQSSARPPFPSFSHSGQVIRPQDVQEVVEYMTKPSSSSSSAVTRSEKSVQSSAVGRGHEDESLSCASTVLDLSTANPEESEELFEHSVSHLDMPDAQSFMEADVGSEVEVEDTNISLQREKTDDRQRGMRVAPAADYCQVVSSGNEDDDDEGSDATWVPHRVQEESEGEEAHVEEAQQARAESRRATPSKARASVSRPAALTSACWAFFNISATDRTVAICNVCHKHIKRGKNPSHLGTSCLNRHLTSHHSARWQAYLKDPRRTQRSVRGPPPPPPSPPPPPPPCAPCGPQPSPVITTHHQSAASTDGDDGIERGVATSSRASTTSTPPSGVHRRQISIPYLMQKKKKYAPSHPHAQRLNASLSKLLALQLLPFNLVDSGPFREFAECAVPQWQVPSRHYFARKALPDLYQHVEGNVASSLAMSVSRNVHLTADTWSSKHGQGRYISFTAHWVTLLASGRDSRQGSVLRLVRPPRLETAGGRSVTITPPSSSSYSLASSMPSSAEQSFERDEVPPTASKGYSMAQAKRCHAVLQLVCLGDRQHTAPEILGALQAQAQRWLTPRRLQPGMVVTDNGSNLLSALRLGKLTHVPCLAHVLNLVVQRFLVSYPGLQDVLRTARRVCSHFRRSYTAAARLAEKQREFHLPQHRLICDMPTRWNSTLAMLQRLYAQQRAVNEYLCEYGTSTGSARLGFFSPRQWLMIKDACAVLSPFEEATRMVSRDSACISDTVPLLFLLDHTLNGIMDRALEAEHQEEEEDFLSSQGPLYSEPITPSSHRPQEDRGGEEEGGADEDEDSMGTFVGFEEEEVEDVRQSARHDLTPSGTLGVVRGWGPEVSDTVQITQPDELASQAFANLRRMTNIMLQSLRKDPRIKALKENDHYWLATLLDHRYKAKVSEMISSAQRAHKLKSLEESLERGVVDAFPDPARMQGSGQPSAESNASQERRVGEGVRLTEALRTFFSPHRPGLSAATSHRQRLHHMVEDYLRTHSDLEAFPCEDPLAYWVLRLDHWPELAQYAIELLACPASSVLSERSFSAAGGVVTDHRTRLSTDSVDRLTFIKMNESWISSFDPPDADAGD